VVLDVGRVVVVSHLGRVMVVMLDAGRVMDDQGTQGQPVFQLIDPAGSE
jgi:hypothetical protein